MHASTRSAARRKRLRRYVDRLQTLQRQKLTHDQLLMKLGAAKHQAGRATNLIKVEIHKDSATTARWELRRLMTDLTGEQIAVWLETEAAKRPTKAAQSYRLLRAFLRWASERPEYRGIVHADAYRTRAVRDALPKSNAKDAPLSLRRRMPITALQSCLRPLVLIPVLRRLPISPHPRSSGHLPMKGVDFRSGLTRISILR